MNLRTLVMGGLLLQSACEPSKPHLGEQEKPPLPSWQVPPEAPAVGSRFLDPDFILSVKAPKPCDKSETLTPVDGFERVSVPVRLEGRTQRVVPVNALDFHLEDKGGRRFPATLAGCAPSLPHKRLIAGDILEGEIAFDVPASKEPWQLVYHPFLIGRTESVARVEVPTLSE